MRVEFASDLFRSNFKLQCDVSFDNGVHLVSGPIGSGKTTMALAMASLIEFSGRLEKHNIDRTIMSLQFPEYHVTTARLDDEVESWGLDPEEVLKFAGLDSRPHLDPFKLSRGQLKMLNLACVFTVNPDLLLLDEPFSSLDCHTKTLVCRAIAARQNKITIVFSHETSVLPKVDSISEIEEGVLYYRGKTPESISKWKSAPPYLRHALELGSSPSNITLDDVQEALCAMRG